MKSTPLEGRFQRPFRDTGEAVSSCPHPEARRWTKRVVTEYTGRDPLGLSRVSDVIADYLLKGITTQTTRSERPVWAA